MSGISHAQPPGLIFERARTLQAAGDLRAAEGLYLELLARVPDRFPILNALALLRFQQAHFGDAIAICDEALGLNPEAISLFLLKSTALAKLGEFDRALACWDLALALAPDRSFLWKGRGDLLLQMSRFQPALEDYERARLLEPHSIAILTNYGFALRHLRRTSEALAIADHLVVLAPSDAGVFYNRGHVLMDLGRYADALRSYDDALHRKADFADAVLSRGVALRHLGRLEEALKACDQAAEMRANYAEAHFNRGVVLAALGERDEEVRSYEKAIAINPQYAEAHFNKGMALLAKGDLKAGLPLYEWRQHLIAGDGQKTNPPRWRNDMDMSGRKLLVQAEQGLGDTIMFSRFAQLVAQNGVNLVFSVQDRLLRLLKGLDPPVSVAAASGASACDFRVPLLSMPLALDVTLSSVPSMSSYLKPESAVVERWAQILGQSGFKIGVAWHARTDGAPDGRSFPLALLYGMSKVAGVRLISLQKQGGLEQLQSLPDGMLVELFDDNFDSGPDAFVDTAGVIQNLDLIITCDTSVAHLAGALGRPTWLALQFSPDWRWLLNRRDSPWYPSMRLFRQKTRNDWTDVFGEMERELRTNLEAI